MRNPSKKPKLQSPVVPPPVFLESHVYNMCIDISMLVLWAIFEKEQADAALRMERNRPLRLCELCTPKLYPAGVYGAEKSFLKTIEEYERSEKAKINPVFIDSLYLHQTSNLNDNKESLRDIWKDIQGCSNWENLLEPLNFHMRMEIIRYGEFAQSCSDSLEYVSVLSNHRLCKFEPTDFFEKLGMANNGYKVTRYIHAPVRIPLKIIKSVRKSKSWIGYIAVVTDETEIKRLGRRDIVIAWRGLGNSTEWEINMRKSFLGRAKISTDAKVKIESAYYNIYTSKEGSCSTCKISAREQVLEEIKRLLALYEGEEISITLTGHGAGAALALISAFDIAETGLNNTHLDYKVPISVYSFASPQVGNLRFKQRCDGLGIKVLRVFNIHDMVPRVSRIWMNRKSKLQKRLEKMLYTQRHAHVGVELALDNNDSPCLKRVTRNYNIFGAHTLELLLHLVDGYQGKGRQFRSTSNRDLSLINKESGLLKNEYGVPQYWLYASQKSWGSIIL